MKGKCLSCNVEIEWDEETKPTWCSIICKKGFYLKYFAGNSDVRVWESEHNKDFKERQQKVMKEIKESGLTATEFLRSLGDFKDG